LWFRRVSRLVTLILLLTACAAQPDSRLTSSPVVQLTSSPVIQLTSSPVLQFSPQPEIRNTAPPKSPLCSPLAVQPLEKLSEIITQPFAMPRILSDGRYSDDAHHGVDLGYYTRDEENFTGTPVLAALNGQIAGLVTDRPPYGNAILLETPFEQIPRRVVESEKIMSGNSLYTLYAHLQNVAPLRLGQAVACGEQLAETGLTGFTGGPHLHFETRWGPAGSNFSEGMAFYRADTSAAERANYDLWRMSGTFHLFDPMEILAGEKK